MRNHPWKAIVSKDVQNEYVRMVRTWAITLSCGHVRYITRLEPPKHKMRCRECSEQNQA